MRPVGEQPPRSPRQPKSTELGGLPQGRALRRRRTTALATSAEEHGARRAHAEGERCAAVATTALATSAEEHGARRAHAAGASVAAGVSARGVAKCSAAERQRRSGCQRSTERPVRARRARVRERPRRRHPRRNARQSKNHLRAHDLSLKARRSAGSHMPTMVRARRARVRERPRRRHPRRNARRSRSSSALTSCRESLALSVIEGRTTTRRLACLSTEARAARGRPGGPRPARTSSTGCRRRRRRRRRCGRAGGGPARRSRSRPGAGRRSCRRGPSG